MGGPISEESVMKPEPMIEIEGKPLLRHIMKICSHYGLNDFIVCLGYKGSIIKEFFADYSLPDVGKVLPGGGPGCALGRPFVRYQVAVVHLLHIREGQDL
jgi:NDP-sugar pyrophosphorylase family protein